MFNFLESWDKVLYDNKQDIDAAIRGETKLWTVAMQSYCERIMDIFNQSEEVIWETNRNTLGVYLDNYDFKIAFQNKVGFYDFKSLKQLNVHANKRKHVGETREAEKKEIQEWYKRIHSLSVKVFNFLEKQDVHEEYDEGLVNNLIASSEQEIIDIADYADNLISRKNVLISDLDGENKKLRHEIYSLEQRIGKDMNDIIKYNNELKTCEIERLSLKEDILIYKEILDKMAEYIELSKHKEHAFDIHSELRTLYNADELFTLYQEQQASHVSKRNEIAEAISNLLSDLNIGEPSVIDNIDEEELVDILGEYALIMNMDGDYEDYAKQPRPYFNTPKEYDENNDENNDMENLLKWALDE